MDKLSKPNSDGGFVYVTKSDKFCADRDVEIGFKTTKFSSTTQIYNMTTEMAIDLVNLLDVYIKLQRIKAITLEGKDD